MLTGRMTRERMNDELPNGLHDAEILSFTYKIGDKTLSFDVDVWIGITDEPESMRERYRRGTLTFEGVHFFTKGEPHHLSDEGLQFLDWSLEEDAEGKAKLDTDFKGLFFSFYALYCEIRVACEQVGFEWHVGNEINRHPKEV